MQHFTNHFGTINAADAANGVENCIRLNGDLGPQISKFVCHLSGRQGVKLFFWRVDGGIDSQSTASDNFNLIRRAAWDDFRPLGYSPFRDSESACNRALTTKMPDYVRFEHAL